MVRVSSAIDAAAAATGVSVDSVLMALAMKEAAGVRKILTPAKSSPKLAVNGGHVHIDSALVYLRPSGVFCPAMDSGCSGSTHDGGCYVNGGRGRYSNVRESRERKSQFFMNARQDYMLALAVEIETLRAQAAVSGMVAAVRLNGLSDIAWENYPAGIAPTIMDAFPTVQFWDYTRVPGRINRYRPENYDVTFSLGSDNDRIAARALDAGMRVAVVFRTPIVPECWGDRPVVDGNAHDFRFLELGGIFVALKARGNALRDKSGWVRDYPRDGGLDLTRVSRFHVKRNG